MESKKMYAEEYLKETENLFTEWKVRSNDYNPNRTSFISDGIMDPDTWFSLDQRILFVLKEAYTVNGSEDWDLARDHVLKDGVPSKKIWKRISLWTKGILSPFGTFNECSDDSDLKYFGNQYLHKIAAINIKKYNGNSSSDTEEILDYAAREKDLIKKQIELCDPTMIICGHTAKALNQVIDFGWEKHYNPNRFYHIPLNNHDLLILDFYHPSNQYPEIMNFYTLREIYNNAKTNQG